MLCDGPAEPVEAGHAVPLVSEMNEMAGFRIVDLYPLATQNSVTDFRRVRHSKFSESHFWKPRLGHPLFIKVFAHVAMRRWCLADR